MIEENDLELSEAQIIDPRSDSEQKKENNLLSLILIKEKEKEPH